MDEVEFNWADLKTRTVDGIVDLVTVVAQDEASKKVLMVAYATKEAVEKTIETGFAHYYSTSRKRLWKKGESSGNTQKIKEIRLDCDADAMLYVVDSQGPACHTGQDSCFYRKIRF